MSERVKFIGRLLDGERMSELCREFEISRKTGYKVLRRYESEGIEGLSNKPRLPIYRPNQTPYKIEKLITDLREQHPTWGAPKIKVYLQRKNINIKIPAKSTIHSILERNALVKKRRRKKGYKAEGTKLSVANKPNEIWCTDFKGQFKMQNRQYCYPLTITDQYSRYLLSCEGLESVKENGAFGVFERIFEENGLPDTMRSDNGVPFATNSLFGLSTLSVWWIRLGIKIERIQPGHPEQNGQHERMHRTLKETVLRPPAKNILQQQEKFDAFSKVFNYERPHQGIKMLCPSNIYEKSKKKYLGILNDLEYTGCDRTLRVSQCGSISTGNQKKVFISEVFRGQTLGIKEVDDNIWEIYFMNYTLGYYDEDSYKLNHTVNPFLTKA